MTITEMTSYFDLIQDKPNSPYFTTAEKIFFLNAAQDKFINEYIFQYLFPTHRGGQGSARVYSSVEANEAGAESIEPLFVVDLALSSTASGTISRSSIKSAMNVETGDTTDYLHITSVAKDLGANTVPVQYVRQNDYEQFQRNEFKKATSSAPQYRVRRNGININPTGVADYIISVVKEPIRMVQDDAVPANNVDCELPAFTHQEIVSIALSDAATSTRDDVLAALKQISDRNLTTLA